MMNRKELIREWLFSNIPFAIKPVANNAKHSLVCPFSSAHAQRAVVEHLTELLYEIGFSPTPTVSNLRGIGEDLIDNGIDASVFLDEDAAVFHDLWDRKEFDYQAWRESQKRNSVDDKISSDYIWLGKVLRFLVDRGYA
jgi:hypothetical protein